HHPHRRAALGLRPRGPGGPGGGRAGRRGDAGARLPPLPHAGPAPREAPDVRQLPVPAAGASGLCAGPDMSGQPFTPEEEFQRKVRARRTLTWLIVFAIVMFLAGLT